MEFDATKVLLNARAASTEDLLDRVTFYRVGMEPEAVDIIEAELSRRGVTPEAIAAWGIPGQVLEHQGFPAQCSFCACPAVYEGWDWHRFWGVVPLFPRRFRYCKKHQPAGSALTNS